MTEIMPLRTLGYGKTLPLTFYLPDSKADQGDNKNQLEKPPARMHRDALLTHNIQCQFQGFHESLHSLSLSLKAFTRERKIANSLTVIEECESSHAQNIGDVGHVITLNTKAKVCKRNV